MRKFFLITICSLEATWKTSATQFTSVMWSISEGNRIFVILSIRKWCEGVKCAFLIRIELKVSLRWIYIYIYAFGRCFYPSNLPLHYINICISPCISWNQNHDLGIFSSVYYCLSYRNDAVLWENYLFFKSAFIQSNLYCIHSVYFISSCISWKSNPWSWHFKHHALLFEIGVIFVIFCH